MNTPRGVLEIHSPQNKHILLDNDLADLLGFKRCLQTIKYIKRFKSFTNYLFHCDLLDTNESVSIRPRILSRSFVYLLSWCSRNDVFETHNARDFFALFHSFRWCSRSDFLLFHVLPRSSLGNVSFFGIL